MGTTKPNKNFSLSERSIHLAVMDFISCYNDLSKIIIHIPNESIRSPRYGNLLKRMGMRKGASDLFIAMPSHGYHGAWIELKTKTGKPTKHQLQFLEDMKEQNYFTKVTYGLDDSLSTLRWYCKKQ